MPAPVTPCTPRTRTDLRVNCEPPHSLGTQRGFRCAGFQCVRRCAYAVRHSVIRALFRPAPAPPESPGHRRAREQYELHAAQRAQALSIRARHSLRGVRP